MATPASSPRPPRCPAHWSLAGTGLLAGETFEMTASVGIAIFPDDGHDARGVLQSADMALYRAKAKGKHRVEMSLAHVIADGMTRA